MTPKNGFRTLNKNCRCSITANPSHFYAAMKKVQDQLFAIIERRFKMAHNRTQFTHLEYIEFTAKEFKKFKWMPPITQDDINAVDWDLMEQDFERDYIAPKRKGRE